MYILINYHKSMTTHQEREHIIHTNPPPQKKKREKEA